MTLIVTTFVRCDNCADRTIDLGGPPSQVRAYANRFLGWVSVQRNSSRLDLCQACKHLAKEDS